MEIIPQKPISFWFQYFEITMSRQLDCEFENALENNKLRDSLLMLLLKDSLYTAARVTRSTTILLVDRWHAMWNAIFNDIKRKVKKTTTNNNTPPVTIETGKYTYLHPKIQK